MTRWGKRSRLKDRSYMERVIGKASLCPECNLAYLAHHFPKRRSYTRTASERSTLKVCADLRRLAKQAGETCKFYKGESLNGFLGHKRRKR